MDLEKSCKYYEDSKCILKGGCCDLNCDMASYIDRGGHFYDEIDTFTKWWIEREQREVSSRLN